MANIVKVVDGWQVEDRDGQATVLDVAAAVDRVVDIAGQMRLMPETAVILSHLGEAVRAFRKQQGAE